MKISVNAIRAFNERYNSAGNPVSEGIDKLTERIGAQLAAIEETIPVGDKYAGVVIARVVECRKHENSDHLSVCLVDDSGVVEGVGRNENGLVQVVCGAPNVRAGLTVAWLPPGSTVPSSFDGEHFVLGARELRGEISNGMLASPKELALGDNHDGILEIDEDVAPGTLFADKYGLAGDVVIDMENKMFTHRPDLFGMLGVARELAGIQGQRFASPQWYRSNAVIEAPAESELRVEVRNEIPNLVPRFVVVPMSGITIKPSPVWLQVELSRLGVRPINNVVDLTNFFMLLTGQPLHAYDYDKVVAQDGSNEGATIVVRTPHEGEKLELLNGKTVEPRAEAILIASATRAIGLGGVMGGGETEVDTNTKNIILECASFDMYSIRRTSMAHGIFSDAVTRFNKGQSPLQNLAVLAKIVEDIARIAGGKVAGPVIDDNHVSDDARGRNSLHPFVNVSVGFINERLGLQLSGDDMTRLLSNVEFNITSDGEDLTIQAPFWRTDIEIPEDIVEEVGRLYGFDKLPLELPRRSLTPAAKDAGFELKRQLRDKLSRAGANELLTYSFVHGNIIDKSGQNRELAFKLSNALSPDLQYYRLSLTPSLLDKVHSNIKAGFDEFALFELGKAHAANELDEEGVPRQFNCLSLVFAAEPRTAAQKYQGAAFYQARKYLDSLFGGQLPFTLIPLAEADFGGHAMMEQMCQPFDPARSAVLWDGERINGVVGEYKSAVAKAFKLPKFAAGFELFMSALAKHVGKAYVPLPRFPKVWQDVCLRVPDGVSYQELYNFVAQELRVGPSAKRLSSLTPVDIYKRPDETDFKQITLRFSIASYEKTMTDSEVSGLLDKAVQAAAETFSAERV